jgi:hypothetical protein
LISPKKSQDKLEEIGNKLAKQYNCEFIFKDYRSGNGIELQGLEVKQNNLYRQNYCGCLYGLNAQRDYQNKLADELMMPIGQQIQPESIEERLDLYKKRTSVKKCEIIKQRFLNYRLLNGKVTLNKKVIPSYFLCYSTLKNQKTQGKIEKTLHNIGYLNKDEVKIVSLETFNTLAKTNFQTIYELIYNPLSFDEELKVRNHITKNQFDISTIIIIENTSEGKFEITCNSKIFEDIKEEILL